MFTKQEQRSWIKIEVARGRSAQTVIRDCEKQVVMLLCQIAQWHQYQREGDDFLGRMVTLDETRARSYEPHLKRQSHEWKHPGSPRPKKVRPTQSNVKAMFIVAYDIDGVISEQNK
jgi:hypothetical protein